MEGKGHCAVIDVNDILAEQVEKWVNVDLTQVNDAIVRLGLFEGEFHWHKHDVEDELFFVLEGTLLLDLPGGTEELTPWQGYTVPHGVMHRTRAEERTVVLMIEKAGVKPRGD
ncbi:MAG: cupin domain-containing protein [Thermoplasmata archaeon]|nr:MAG: cupin domain-containing protein [Thermoplasmata archaeon]